jgi:hypothetical protein
MVEEGLCVWTLDTKDAKGKLFGGGPSLIILDAKNIF